MADGIELSFRKHHRENMRKALKLMADIDISKAECKEILSKIEDVHIVYPRIERNEDFDRYEAEILSDKYPELKPEVIKKCQDFTFEESYKDTDRETYQTMESFIHNLNTMQSRAGSQTVFSSINFGLDRRPEAKMAIKNYLLAAENGLGRHETPIFP